MRSIKVKQQSDDTFAVEVDFIFQQKMPEKAIRSHEGKYQHVMQVMPDGSMVFIKMKSSTGKAIPTGDFVSSFAENRARAVVIQFQSVMDSLSGSGEALRELIHDDAVFTGLLSKPKNKKLDMSKWDSDLHGYEELADWFSVGPTVFKSISHRLKSFVFEDLGDNRYIAVVTFYWDAETLDGKLVKKRKIPEPG